ncbi:DUF2752 domain-containing protein [Sunxiuqinia sp. A32]|uniref:DUF2752 domain-containing protein n=1 Tax=Sunxiuqinia sp. A32 TaxID=3461496 RepID=UPI004045CC2B
MYQPFAKKGKHEEMEISIIPRFLIRRISDNDIQQINWNILISTILILFSLIFINLSMMNAIPHFCLVERLIGIPCPVCGVSRSVLSLYDFKIMDSLKYNPNGLLIAIAFLTQIPLRMIALFDGKYYPMIEKISRSMTRLLLVTLLTYWFYKLFI